MIEKIFIISFIVFAIHYAMKEGEIFGFLGNWLYEKLPEVLHNPVFDCVVCMAPWYGSILYWTIWHGQVVEWLVVVIASMGLNSIIGRLSVKETDEL